MNGETGTKFQKYMHSIVTTAQFVASKLYKNDINKKFRQYQDSLIKRIRNLQSTDPKQYWNILNRGSNSRQNLHDISKETFLDHFKNLNIIQNTDYEDLQPEEITHLNDELDEPISENEVLKAIKSLKNNKTCSDDLI